MERVRDELWRLPHHVLPQAYERPQETLMEYGVQETEGAEDLFEHSDWRDVDIDALLSHPTALWFLNVAGLEYFLPAIAVSIVTAVRTGNPDFGRDVFDHLESKIDKENARSGFELSVGNRELYCYIEEMMRNELLSDG